MTENCVDLLSGLFEKISLNSYEPGHSYWVDVTHINNPLSFYVRPTAYRHFMDELQAHEGSLNPKDLNIQTKVIYNSRTLNKHIRGIIISMENNEDNRTCCIFAPDYGFLDTSVSVKDLFKPKARNIPPLAVHCKLGDCKPLGKSWTGKEVDAMKCYVSGERARLVVIEKTGDNLTVELINSMPDDIATMLALTGYTTLGYDENVISRLTNVESQKLYFTFKETKPNDVFRVRLQEGKELNDFYVAEKDDFQKYLGEIENITYFCKKLKDLTVEDFVINQCVGVGDASTYKFERGIIKEILSSTRARVQLIDWGKIIETHISLLKPMSEKFYYYPAVAMYCSVEDNQLSDPRLLKYLYPGYEFLVKIKEVGDKFNKPNIVQILPGKM